MASSDNFHQLDPHHNLMGLPHEAKDPTHEELVEESLVHLRVLSRHLADEAMVIPGGDFDNSLIRHMAVQLQEEIVRSEAVVQVTPAELEMEKPEID